MNIKNWKLRAATLGIAVLMGINSLGVAPYVYAAETDQNTSERIVAEQPVKETEEATETDVPIKTEERKVIAEDITKDISEDFAVETCMEGIHYNVGQESVTLSCIKGEDGSDYRADKAGTYTAIYLVVPKDKQDSYTITRKVILTDTEGQAHIESNGGERQKEDTQSESDSEEDTTLKVEVCSTDETDTKEAVDQLKEDIESGNILLFSGADNQFSARSTVKLEKGETISYPSYIGSYVTNWFRVNGKTAYCLEAHRVAPPSGDYVAEVLDSNKNLQKVLYYGYGGAGDITGSYLSEKTADEKYVYTHIAASYAYAGEAGFTGCNYDDLVSAGVIAYIDHLFGMEEPPKGELKLSKTTVDAVQSGDIQKTPNIKLSGDHRNFITITVPKDVTCYNKTKDKSVTNGKLKIYGGDTFYLTAKISVSGSYSSGKLYGSIEETWRTLVLTTGEANQDIGVFESESAKPVSFKVNWAKMARVALVKKDATTKNPLKGAVYGIYKDAACKELFIRMPVTEADGKAVSDYFDAGISKVYVKEISAPISYATNQTVYPIQVSAGKTVEVTVEDKPVKGNITVKKEDVDTQAFLPQGDAKLEGAVYGLYAREDIQNPDGTGVLYKKGSLIQQQTIGTSGEAVFRDVYLGTMFIKEILSPPGYLLDTTEYDATLTYEGQEKELVVKPITVKEQVEKQAFQIIKVSEDGEQTETDLIKGAEFTIYLVSDLSKVKDGSLKPSNGTAYTAEDFISYDFTGEKPAVTYENGKAISVPVMVTDAKGYAKSVELPYGTYVCIETKTPENLKQVNPFVVTVDKDSREPQQWRIFDDRPFDFLLKIIKKDAQTEQPVLKNSATYKIYDCERETYVEQTVNYPKKDKISEFSTNEEGYLVLPQPLKAGHYRIEEISAPKSFVRQGYEERLVDGEHTISPLEVTEKGAYIGSEKEKIELVINADSPHQIDPDTGAYVVEVTQYNDEQVGSLTLHKVGEQLKEVKGASIFEKAAELFTDLKDAVTGEETERLGLKKEFLYEEAGVEGAVFELYAKDTIYSPDGAADEDGNPVIRYAKNDLVATLTTDADGKAVLHNLPLGSFYLKETKAGDHFVLNPEQKEFTLTPEDDTVAVVYEDVTYKNERQKIEISVHKKDSISGSPLKGVVFGLYAGEDILSNQGEILLKKDTLLETKATGEDGTLTFDSQVIHGTYYVKEEQRLPGYMPNEEIWKIEALYEDQSVAALTLAKNVENQPTKSQFTKSDAVTGKEVEGARLQILDSKGKVVEEWVSGKEAHVVYGLPEGSYALHEELAPLADGYVSASDIEFKVLEDGSVTKVEMKDAYSKTEISKTDIATGKELKGAKLQVLDKDGKILEEWVTDGNPHTVEKLPVGKELTLREITAPEGYEIAEDMKFTLEDTMEVQKVEMKDARLPETPVVSVPKTGDNPWKPLILLAVCGLSVTALVVIAVRKRKRSKAAKTDKTDEKTAE